MKAGDVVMFNNQNSIYAKWFYGKIGVVKSIRENAKGEEYCGINWLIPVLYHGNHSSSSSFPSSDFMGVE